MSKPVGRELAGHHDIQTVVDELADELKRSVAVDHPNLELVCASAQMGPIDQWRINAIIDRSPPQTPLPWLHSHGIATSTRPVRIPGNDEHGLLPRVCFPIRNDGVLLGYLWLFDDPAVTEDVMARASRAVDALVPLMAADDDAVRGRVEDMARLLAAAAIEDTAAAAVTEAVARGYLSATGEISVQVMTLAASSRRRASANSRNLASELARRQVGRSYLARLDANDLLTINRCSSLREFRDVTSLITRVVRSAGFDIHVAGAATAHSPTAIAEAFRQARFAATLSDLLQPGGGSLHWNEVGSWQLLYGRPLTRETVRSVSSDAQRLLDSGSDEQWRTTLTFLDSARSVAHTCQLLTIHRATLYYRLERVRDLLGADALDDGWRATALHVALKLHRALEAGAGPHSSVLPR